MLFASSQMLYIVSWITNKGCDVNKSYYFHRNDPTAVTGAADLITTFIA